MAERASETQEPSWQQNFFCVFYTTVTVGIMLCSSVMSLPALLPPQSNLFIMDIDNWYDDKEASLEIFWTEDAKEAYRQVALECTKVFVWVADAAALVFGGPLYNKILYHTSALLGLNWALELIDGHPEWI